VFATGWYLIVFLHGDTRNVHNTEWRPCISGIENFTAAFLFSVETQHTTGYGFYHLTEECPEAIFLFCIQSIFGVILEGLMVGLVFIKMSRAKKRSETLMFSRNAVISRRDGVPHFMFRIGGDCINIEFHMIKIQLSILDTFVISCRYEKKPFTWSSRSSSINSKKDNSRRRSNHFSSGGAEGLVFWIPFISEHLRTITITKCLYLVCLKLKVGGDGEMRDKILLFWPTTVVHKITEDSPLYNITQDDLHPYNNSFEIIVVLEGINESTGLTAQARSSYLPSEVISRVVSSLTVTNVYLKS